MARILAAILGWLAGLLTRKPAGPSVEERLGRAEAHRETQEATHAAVQDALDARRDAAARVVREPETIRQPNRYSRD